MPEKPPDDPQFLKQMLAKMQSRVGLLEEENALVRLRLPQTRDWRKSQ
jgi:hypothetical protein